MKMKKRMRTILIDFFKWRKVLGRRNRKKHRKFQEKNMNNVQQNKLGQIHVQNLKVSDKPSFPKVDGIRISPYAFQKLSYMMWRDKVEITGFGVSPPGMAEQGIIHDFQLVKQEVSSVTVDMDTGLGDYLSEMSDLGINPLDCFRYWIHTHPSSSTVPSSTDWETFKEVGEKFSWFAMIIFGQDQSSSCHMRVDCGPFKRGIPIKLGVNIDWSIPPINTVCGEELFAMWEDEYQEKVHKKIYNTIQPNTTYGQQGQWQSGYYTKYKQLPPKPKASEARDENVNPSPYNAHYSDPWSY